MHSGSPYEKQFGFCRAVRIGERIIVAGTAPIEPDGSSTLGTAFDQAVRCFRIIQAAIEELGGKMTGVVRTRMFITDARVAEEVGRAHGAFFAVAAPAATMVVVKGLLRPEWQVEIEAEAIVG